MSFEERYNRWIDGLLDSREERALLDELPRRGIPSDEATTVRRTGARLRAGAPLLEHPDVFREQVLDRLRRESTREHRTPGARAVGFRLAGAGSALVALAALGFLVLIPKPWQGPRVATEVYSLWTETDRISAVAVRAPDDSGAVVWLEGLEYLPASHDLLH